MLVQSIPRSQMCTWVAALLAVFTLPACNSPVGKAAPTPTATATPTPTPGATPTPLVMITSPSEGTTVSGTVTVTAHVAPSIYVGKLYADTQGVETSQGQSAPTYTFTWNSTSVPDGTHNLTVKGFASGSTTPSWVDSVDVVVANNSADAGALHFGTLAPHASLPSDSECASLIAITSETVPSNTSYNSSSAIPTSAELCSFHAAPLYSGTFVPTSDFALVDGNYSGSTDMIIRWAACKWGIDEDVLRAEAWGESQWLQDAAGDWRTTESDCTNSVQTSCSTGGTWNAWNGSGCYQSYGIFQVKLYSFNAYPEAEDSTAFNADFRAAYARACLNGDINYLASRTPSTGYPDYPQGDLSQMLWGCMGDWYSGSWFDSGALTYINDVESYLYNQPWPK